MSGPEGFIDTHVHFWDHSVEGLRWPWLEAGFTHRDVVGTDALDAPRYTTPEFLAESRGAGVGGLIHVQAVDGVDDLALETRWLQHLADDTGLPDAIVASCTVGDPDAVDLLERHAVAGRFAGVRDIRAARHLDADQAAPALSWLAERNLVFEARRHHEQFDVLDRIAERWPTLTVVLSHACLPSDRGAPSLAAWTSASQRLATRHSNIVCKISAVAGASDPQWTVGSIRPWIRACIDTFGPERCMFGTNWPIDRLHGSYTDVVAAYREIVDDLATRDRSAVLSGTARRVYGLVERSGGQTG